MISQYEYEQLVDNLQWANGGIQHRDAAKALNSLYDSLQDDLIELEQVIRPKEAEIAKLRAIVDRQAQQMRAYQLSIIKLTGTTPRQTKGGTRRGGVAGRKAAHSKARAKVSGARSGSAVRGRKRGDRSRAA